MTLTEEAADWLDTYNDDDDAHAAALAINGDLWIAALLDEIDRLAVALIGARSAAEEEASQVDRLKLEADHYAEAARDWKREARHTTIRTPTEANATPARTVLLDTCEYVWQHNIEPATLWEDRIDYWTTPGDEEAHDANDIAYPARIIYQPEEAA